MISYRTCIVTRNKFDKRKLLKVTKTKDGKWQLDKECVIDGRSIYISKDKESILKFNKMRKRFKICQIDFDRIKEELGELIEKENL